jgi:hypothetical protein
MTRARTPSQSNLERATGSKADGAKACCFRTAFAATDIGFFVTKWESGFSGITAITDNYLVDG